MINFKIRTEFPCGDRFDFKTISGNSDAMCFRKKSAYALRLVNKNPELCNKCIYNKKNE